MRKLAVITGADGGMGTEITRAVAKAGYDVIMLCNVLFKGEERKNRLVLDTGNRHIEVRQVELASMESVMHVADTLLKDGRRIDLLMNNAGTMATHYRQTEDGLEYTVAVNYMAHFFLTTKLLPLMGEGSRIVNMVSCTYVCGRITPDFFTKGRSGAFWRIPIYSNTKLALWLFTRELAERVRERGITVNAADPGVVSTNIIRMDMWFDPLTDLLFRPCIRTPQQGAATAIHLLLDADVAGVTGGLFASCKPKKVKEHFLHHPQAKQLWDDSVRFLDSLKLCTVTE